MSQYSGNNSNGQFNPSYSVDGERTPINVEQLAIEVNGKQITGYQTTYANGISKWTASVHQDQIWDTENVDRSTFTGKKVDGRWIWEPTTNNSVSNLANDWRGNGLDLDEVSTNDINRSFFNDPNFKKNFNNTRLEALKAKEGGSLAKVKEKFPLLPGTNTATAAEGANSENDNFSIGTQDQINDSIQDAKDTRTKYGNYYYPQGIEGNKQDRIVFGMKRSSGRRIDTSLNANVKSFQRRSSRIEGSVTLPITTGIKDLNSVDWQGSTMNPLQAFGAATAFKAFNAVGDNNPDTTLQGVGGDAMTAARKAVQQDNSVRGAINTWLAGQAVGTQNLLSRATGAIANPNMEMLFNAPALRAFDFTFQMSPRDATEAAQIKSIINFFKQGMAVKTSTNNIFLKSPNIFTIQYKTFNNNGEMTDHQSLNRINDCALLSCAVDYTPNNSYMTYSDSTRSMVSYTMNLQFNELDPLYESDYRQKLNMKNSDAKSTKIGY